MTGNNRVNIGCEFQQLLSRVYFIPYIEDGLVILKQTCLHRRRKFTRNEYAGSYIHWLCPLIN